MSALPLLKLEGITKSYSGVRVLEEVGLEVRAGEVHALLGENGAGKTTLMNIVSGNTRADHGRMYWRGEAVALRDPREGRRLGIAYVHQEPALVAPLSAAENIFLGRHPARRVLLDWVRWGEIHDRAGALLRQLGCSVDPARPIEQLSLAERQMVEIARALAFEACLIILDEPTAPLSEREAVRLFGILAQLKTRGVSVIYISHRLKEVYQCADRVTVLRDRPAHRHQARRRDRSGLAGAVDGRPGGQGRNRSRARCPRRDRGPPCRGLLPAGQVPPGELHRASR